MKILFVRHGETDMNAQGHLHRPNDLASLNQTGIEQAKRLVGICKENEVELIMSSPEKRAEETAQILADALHVKVKTLMGLHERSWGDWADKKWSEIQIELDVMTLDDRYNFVPPNGESWAQVVHRLKNALQVVVAQPVQNVAVVTHGGVLRALMPILRNEPRESSFVYDFKNSEVVIFEFKNRKFTQL